MSIEALKEQARNHEQKEDWAKALEAYQEAIARQRDEDQPDLGLYNRAGDLSTRLNDKLGAIGHYERAVELYLESELPNNAIAILKKILRNIPDRSEVYLRIGQIRAAQGFLTDARDNFLKYAEQMQHAGNMEEAFRALSEFAELAPDDVDTRLALAEQFKAHERTRDALDQLLRARQTLVGRGDVDAAAAIGERILEIDPDAVLTEVSAPTAPTAPTASSAPTSAETSYGDVELSYGDPEAAIDHTPEPAVDGIDFDGDFGSEGLEDDAEEHTEPVEAAIQEPDAATFDDVLQLDDFEPTSAAMPELDYADGTDSELDPAEETLPFPGSDSHIDPPETESAPSDAEPLVLDESDDGVLGDLDLQADDDGASPGHSWEETVDAEPHSDAPALAAEEPELPVDSFVLDDDAVVLDAETTWDDEDDAREIDTIALDAPEADAPADDDEADVLLAGSLEAAFINFDELDAAKAAADAAAEEAAEEAAEQAAVAAADSEAAATAEAEAFDWTTADDVDTSMAEDVGVAGADTSTPSWDSELNDDPADFEEGEGAPLADEGAVAVETTDFEALEFGAAEVGVDEWVGADESALDEEAEGAQDEARDGGDTTWAHEFELESVQFDSMDEGDLREYVDAHPDAGSAWEHLGRLVVARGDQSDAAEAFERAHHAFAAGRDFHSAMRNVRELLLIDPDSVAQHQRLVEYAHRGDDRTLLVSAFLELGDCLRRTGEPEKSDAVYEKVLEIDPANRRARVALGVVDSGETAEAPEESYVDLGSMILEKTEKTTRWTVETGDPTGDEEFDFQDMLKQFRAKVAEHVDVDDVQAHYDLGTAYKEMGLLDEAISEFQQALRADGQNLATYELLGQTFMEKGQPEVAIRTLSRATEMPFDVEDELLGIYYYLGRAHEELGNSDDAVEYYEKVFALDINFEDVTERLRSLR